VRLKAATRACFGTAEEELTALKRGRVSLEIIPGVTAASSRSAAAMIPLTAPVTGGAVQFIHRHGESGACCRGRSEHGALADPHSKTTVVYMAAAPFAGSPRG